MRVILTCYFYGERWVSRVFAISRNFYGLSGKSSHLLFLYAQLRIFLKLLPTFLRLEVISLSRFCNLWERLFYIRFIRIGWCFVLFFAEEDIDELNIHVVRYRPEELSKLTKITKFNKKEIQLIYRGFKQVIDFFFEFFDKEVKRSVFVRFFKCSIFQIFYPLIFPIFLLSILKTVEIVESSNLRLSYDLYTYDKCPIFSVHIFSVLLVRSVDE